MDRFYRVLAELATDSALPEDVVVNTWHFASYDVIPGTTPQDTANDMFDQLVSFYNNMTANLAPATITGAITLTAYDLNDPTPRVPVHTRAFTANAGAGAALPHEVAMCLSMKADVPSGANARRRRGRVYIGPIKQAVAEQGIGKVIITQAQRDGLVDMARIAFHNALIGTDPYLCIYSPTTDAAGASLADSFFKVTEFHVDDAFDIQRRRGAAPTARSVYVVPGR